MVSHVFPPLSTRTSSAPPSLTADIDGVRHPLSTCVSTVHRVHSLIVNYAITGNGTLLRVDEGRCVFGDLGRETKKE